MGLDYYQAGKMGELTVFSDEISHTYAEGADQGETAVVYAEHELSHQFYGMLAKTDNTHLYFYAGTPQKVLADFDFTEQELSWYQQTAQDLEQELGLLKARQIPAIGDPAPQSQNLPPQSSDTPQTAQPSPTAPSVADLFNFIKSYEGWAGPGQTVNGVEYPNGTISYQCNNPMNAKWANQANARPRTFDINGRQEIFASFDDIQDGTAYGMDCLTQVVNGTDEVYSVAAHNLGLANSGDLTLNQFFSIRDDASDGNNPTAYSDAAGKQFGVNPAAFTMKQFSIS
jgi:hypothetical protein